MEATALVAESVWPTLSLSAKFSSELHRGLTMLSSKYFTFFVESPSRFYIEYDTKGRYWRNSIVQQLL